MMVIAVGMHAPLAVSRIRLCVYFKEALRRGIFEFFSIIYHHEKEKERE
jgi:hypothetical protein